MKDLKILELKNEINIFKKTTFSNILKDIESVSFLRYTNFIPVKDSFSGDYIYYDNYSSVSDMVHSIFNNVSVCLYNLEKLNYKKTLLNKPRLTTSFFGLTEIPSKTNFDSTSIYLKVTDDETAFEVTSNPSEDSSFLGFSDTPNSYKGNSNKLFYFNGMQAYATEVAQTAFENKNRISFFLEEEDADDEFNSDILQTFLSTRGEGCEVLINFSTSLEGTAVAKIYMAVNGSTPEEPPYISLPLGSDDPYSYKLLYTTSFGTQLLITNTRGL